MLLVLDGKLPPAVAPGNRGSVSLREPPPRDAEAGPSRGCPRFISFSRVPQTALWWACVHVAQVRGWVSDVGPQVQGSARPAPPLPGSTWVPGLPSPVTPPSGAGVEAQRVLLALADVGGRGCPGGPPGSSRRRRAGGRGLTADRGAEPLWGSCLLQDGGRGRPEVRAEKVDPLL